MLYSTLIAKVDSYIDSHIDEEGCQEIIRQAKSYGADVGRYLDELDIRNVTKLRDLIPGAFPKNLQAPRTLSAWNDDKGRWNVTNYMPNPKWRV
jgi:hypothetical protein